MGGGRQGYLAASVCAQIAGMSQAVCLFWPPTSLAFGADLEDASSEALIFSTQGGQSLRMSRSVCL
eukprot:8457056-Pyramimonas_sp.AAC.1